MNNRKDELLTSYELLFTLIGCVIGVGVLSLPNSIVAEAKQDGWIATFIGAAYPVYLILVGGIILRAYPDKTIMDVSRLHLGKILGNFFNILFMLQFVIYIIGVLGAANSVLLVYAVWFLTPLKITFILVSLVVYACIKGLKIIAKINVIMFFVILFLVLSSAMALKYGSILNVQPIFGVGLGKISKASLESAFAYGNMEILFVINPYIKNKKNIIQIALLATVIITVIYVWTVFITTYYLGPDIVPKSLWPYFFVSESVKIPAITSFRFIFMAFWILIIFKTAASQYYSAISIINNILYKLEKKWICLLLSPIILFFPLLFHNEIARRSFFSDIMPWITLFNLFYITLISMFTLCKRNKRR